MHRVGVPLLSLSVLLACGADPEVAEPKPTPAPVAPRAVVPPAPVPAPPSFPDTPSSREQAVARLTAIYDAHRETLYCGCSFGSDGRVSKGSCGYQTRADENLARVIAWEQIVPTVRYGSERSCWKTALCSREDGSQFSGVECCRQIDAEFRAMETDLHNFAPVVAELSQDRSNYGFGELEGEPRLYGSCDFEVSREQAIAEPAPDVRGDVARTYLYMFATYPNAFVLTADELQRLRAWSEADPPDAWEVERNGAIAAIQGRANPFIATEPLAHSERPADEATPPPAAKPTRDDEAPAKLDPEEHAAAIVHDGALPG